MLGDARDDAADPTVWSNSFTVIVACFAVATFAYAGFSTIILNLPADLFPSARGIRQRHGRNRRGARHDRRDLPHRLGGRSLLVRTHPVGASLVPLVALAAVLLLVRNTEATRAGVVHEI